MSTGPDTNDPRWALIDQRTRERLLLARQRNFDSYVILRNQALNAAEAAQRSLERHAERTAGRVVVAATAQGVADPEFTRALSTDLSDYGFDPSVRQSLLDLRRRDLVKFCVEFATARDKAAEARKVAGEASS